MKKKFEYLRDGLRFEWFGGAYIEVFEENATVPHAVINVWDYAKDVSRIEVSMRGLVNCVDDWIDEYIES